MSGKDQQDTDRNREVFSPWPESDSYMEALMDPSECCPRFASEKQQELDCRQRTTHLNMKYIMKRLLQVRSSPATYIQEKHAGLCDIRTLPPIRPTCLGREVGKTAGMRRRRGGARKIVRTWCCLDSGICAEYRLLAKSAKSRHMASKLAKGDPNSMKPWV